MSSFAFSLNALFSPLVGELPVPVEHKLSLERDTLTISGRHTARFQHIIDDLGVKVNGKLVHDIGFESSISGEKEEVQIVLPFEPKPGDVITVDTAVHQFGSRKITLRVE